jgi:hypothetical protein
MNEPAMESFLARLYTNEESRARFLADPPGEAKRAGLSAAAAAAVTKIDPIQLRLAARSFAHKRHEHAEHEASRPTLWQRWTTKFRR